MQLSAMLGKNVDLSEVRAKFASGDQKGALDALKAQKGREKNPFVIGAQSTQRALTVMNECAKATKVVWQMPKK
jgi:hypothetical protein